MNETDGDQSRFVFSQPNSFKDNVELVLPTPEKPIYRSSEKDLLPCSIILPGTRIDISKNSKPWLVEVSKRSEANIGDHGLVVIQIDDKSAPKGWAMYKVLKKGVACTQEKRKSWQRENVRYLDVFQGAIICAQKTKVKPYIFNTFENPNADAPLPHQVQE